MSGELIERLRERQTLCRMSGGRTVTVPDILCNEAADEITRLRELHRAALDVAAANLATATRLRAELSSLRGEEAWERLKARCCSDPTKATQCVMVSKANFLAAIAHPLPDTVLPRPRRNASPSEVKTGRQGIGEV